MRKKCGLCWSHGERQLSVTRRALVLGGGGFVVSAWELGLISGVAATGVDLRDYDMFLGTSSGARLALYLASGSDLDELFHQQLGPLELFGNFEPCLVCGRRNTRFGLLL